MGERPGWLLAVAFASRLGSELTMVALDSLSAWASLSGLPVGPSCLRRGLTFFDCD